MNSSDATAEDRYEKIVDKLVAVGEKPLLAAKDG